MRNSEGDAIAAPVVAFSHIGPRAGEMMGSRWVFLDFEPDTGFWESSEGILLMRAAANWAQQGATAFSLETQYGTLRPGEMPEIAIHVRNGSRERENLPQTGSVRVDLLKADHVIASSEVPISGVLGDQRVEFQKALQPGFYTLRGTYTEGGATRALAQNGFWVEDSTALSTGPALGVHGDFLSIDGKPFFPFGTNYFTTEDNGWDFSGPRNAAVWERDFADMEKHGVSFVRTGVWGGQIRFVSMGEGGVTERFLRNVEAYLLCARRHHIAVNFTFFAFDPQTTLRLSEDSPSAFLPGSNPYLDPVTVRAEQNYLLSIVERFKDVPDLCWDLINEPSFSNPRRLWHGNTPNGDAAELTAWRAWLQEKYGTLQNLAVAWSVTPDQLQSFDSVPLPSDADLAMNLEHGQVGQVRAGDYNLFAQDMFARWVKTMVAAIHSTGSKQLIDVGQDEGGVENRLLNQFYAGAGVSFTANHTYRANSALLWDSLAAKVVGVPNIVGETGYQPIILPNGDWHFDEMTGFSLIERKWAAGFAAATSGALSWDWAREIYFGIKRSDGSNKTWVNMMRDMGSFAKRAEAYATGLIQPEVAIVLPQSLQLSEFNQLAIQAQQNCVRALYGYARSEAYAVGEDQMERLGNPKLIIVPSPWILTEKSWDALLQKVNDGAVLLISGRFDQDAHFNATNRAEAAGLPYAPGELFTRDNEIAWPGGTAHLIYSGTKTDLLERAVFADGKTFEEKSIGKGKILFAAFPLELNDNLEAVGQIYSYALAVAGVTPVYSSTVRDAGILISPTRFPHATLYAVSSETDETKISFTDERTRKQFSSELSPGRAALLLVDDSGNVVASYNWK